jgi:hypothetical protein
MPDLPVTYEKPMPTLGGFAIIKLGGGLVRWETEESVTYFDEATHHVVDGELKEQPSS